MRKKQLIFQIDKLVLKNSELYDDNIALCKDIELKAQKITALENKIVELEEMLMNKTNESPCNNESYEKQVLVQSENNDETETVSEIKEVLLSNEVNNASTVIGEVVLKCAELCNEFTELGGQNAKDLINLALGRTEVFKSDVLEIVSNDDSETDKEKAITDKVNSVYEYFELLKKQQ